MSKNTLAPTDESSSLNNQNATVAVRSGMAYQQNTVRNIGLVTGREYKNRVTQRSFLISTILLLVIVSIAAFIPTAIQFFTSRSNSQIKLVVVNNAGEVGGMSGDTLIRSIKTALNGTSSSQFVVNLGTGSVSSLQKKVSDGSIDILLTLDRDANQDVRFTYYTNASLTDTSNAAQIQQIQGLATQLSEVDTSATLHLTQQQEQKLFTPPTFTIVHTSNDTRSVGDQLAGFFIAYVGVILIFMSVYLYGIGVANGVAEEKGSRIMEILINATTPFQLLAGKVLGIGAAGLTQLVCLVVVGIGALELQPPLQQALFGTATSSGLTINITSVSITLLLCVLLYFILGYLLYATLFAAMGALVKRQDEVQNAVAPLTTLFMAAYLISFLGASSANAVWFRILSFIPFFTPTTMLMRVGNGTVAGWEIALSVVIMIAAILVCTAISARIYRVAVLMYGQKPGLGQLIKIARAK
jgi:ABC-2 type transport system permease protein